MIELKKHAIRTILALLIISLGYAQFLRWQTFAVIVYFALFLLLIIAFIEWRRQLLRRGV